MCCRFCNLGPLPCADFQKDGHAGQDHREGDGENLVRLLELLVKEGLTLAAEVRAEDWLEETEPAKHLFPARAREWR